jgi:hypothetical protein
MMANEHQISTNTNGNKEKAGQLAKASVICGSIGVGCSLVWPALVIYLLLESGGYEPHFLFAEILLGIIVILGLSAVVLGVVSLRGHPAPVSRKVAIAGVLLGITPLILAGSLFIVNR